ncbi:MAG: aldo/keto reductase [Ignavibacteriae bacterium]|nr:MAG: aldo/keto reductase [Ignavibacteriota bacterium]
MDKLIIANIASKEDTGKFSLQFPEQMYKPFGKTGLTVSACGFGCYRVDYRVNEHFNALEYALLNGINIIDTSANYSDGGSEILIGNVLWKLIEEIKLLREEVVVVTKGGYIQGKNYEYAQKKAENGEPYKEVVDYSEGLWHCIHPDFLSDQITQSLDRLKTKAVDVYLLHNPEYFLDSKMAQDLSLDEMRFEYYRRIKKAFEFLEGEVEKGTIGCYGISSNSFIHEMDSPTFTSLEMCLQAAREVKEDNHFYVIQLPLNLYENGAVTIKNQKHETKTTLEIAKENKIAVMVNRPLNAIQGKSLHRLIDFEIYPEFLNVDEAQIIAEIELLDSLEESFLKDYLELLNLSDQNREAVNYFLKAGQLLKENWKNFGSIESFNDVKKQFLIPRVNYAFSAMIKSPNVTSEMKDRLDVIAKQINKLMRIMETIYGIIANSRSKEISNKLDKLVTAEQSMQFKELSLSQKAILLINSLEGISTTLVGMRLEKYVADVVKSLKMKKIENAKEVFEKFEV